MKMCIWVIIQLCTHNLWQGVLQNEKEYNAFIPPWVETPRRKVHCVCLLFISLWKEYEDFLNMWCCCPVLTSYFSQYRWPPVYNLIVLSLDVPVAALTTHTYFVKPALKTNFMETQRQEGYNTGPCEHVKLSGLHFLLALNALSEAYNSRQKSLFLLWRPFFWLWRKKALAGYLNASSNDPIL